MNLGTFHTHNVVNLNLAYSQRIGDKRTATTPWNRFRTHDCGPRRSRADHRQQHLESSEGLQRVRLICGHENRFACRRP